MEVKLKRKQINSIKRGLVYVLSGMVFYLVFIEAPLRIIGY